MFLVKEQTFTIHEFLELQRANKEIKEFDGLIGNRILKNTRLRRMAVFTIGSLMYCQNVLAATDKIAVAGKTLFSMCQSAAYWICLIMCAIEVIKTLMQGDAKGVTRVVTKYVIGFGTLYFLPWLFDLIKSVFS